jgi:hypothetical protein
MITQAAKIRKVKVTPSRETVGEILRKLDPNENVCILDSRQIIACETAARLLEIGSQKFNTILTWTVSEQSKLKTLYLYV